MNKFLIISFKSRNDIYAFENILKQNYIFCSIINTPKGIGSSCTLSIKTNYNALSKITLLLKKANLKSFLGLYSLTQNEFGNQIYKLI